MRLLLYIFFFGGVVSGYSQNIIQNSGFVAANGFWNTTGSFFYGGTGCNTFPCSPANPYAYTAASNCFNIDNASGSLWQLTQQVPANATGGTLILNHRTGTTHTVSTIVDRLDITLEYSNQSFFVGQITNLNPSPAFCTQLVFDISQHITNRRGQNFVVKFTSLQQTDGKNTVFRLDDVTTNITTGGNGGCVIWQNGIQPTMPVVVTAAEYLCQKNIIDNFQSVQDLLGFSLADASEVTVSGLYNGNAPSNFPSDNLPCLVTDIQILPFFQYQATKALCFLDGVDGRPCINRDYFTIQPKATVSYGRALRMLLEGWNLAPDNVGYDIYSHTPSTFLCNVLKDDPNYGYLKKAFQMGLLNDFVSSGCLNNLSPGEFLYVVLYKLHSQFGSPTITAASYFEPNNFDPKNTGNETGIERAVFQTYEQSGFSLPSSGLGIDFDYSYHSSLLEYPTIAEDWQGRSYGNLENHKAALKNYPLGKGWTHSYNIYANILKWPNTSGVTVESAILFHWGDGSIYVYNISTNQFETKGIYDDFIIDGYDNNGNIDRFRIVTKNKITYTFLRSNSQFYCSNIIDRNNNTTSLFYALAECANPPASCVGSTNGRLDYVLDFASNRRINFIYQPNSDLLSEVKDNIGRSFKLYPNRLTYNLDSSSNAKGNTTIYKYCVGDTCNNMLIEIQRPNGNWIKNTYAKRKLKQTQTPNYSASINFSTNYNPGNQTTSSIIQTTPSNGAGYSTSYQHNNLGQPTSVTSVAEAATIQYGDPSNPTLPTYVLDTKTGVATTYNYDTKGNPLQTTLTGGPLSQTTRQWYNANNDVIQTQLPNGSLFNNTYDARGNLINETGPLGFSNQYARNSNGTLNYKTNANNIVSRFGYNSFGNVNKVSIDGTTIQAEAVYDNVSRITHVKDANNTVSKYTHDNNDNIVQTITDTAGLKLTTNYSFDKNDNNVLVIAPKGDSTKLTYDQNDDLVREDFGNNFRVWGYHDDGSLKYYNDKNGHQFSQFYFPSGSGFEGLLQQKDGNALEYYPTSKLLKSTQRGSNKITFDYDALTRVNYVRLEVPNSLFTNEINYEYDVSGFQTKITIPAINKSYRYVPDALNRIVDVFDWNNTLLVHYTYRTDGNLTSEQLGNGVIISYHYDIAGRLDSIYAKKSNGTLLYAVGATLDNLGNHTKESYYVNKGSLPTITNQLNDSTINYQYDNTNNRLQNTNALPATNDNAGNILTNQYATFSNGNYDFWEHLQGGTVDGKNFSFSYDPASNRFRVDTTLYIQDLLNNGNVLATRTTTNQNITKLFCHSPYGLVCSIDPNTNQKLWYLYDFRGSTVAIVDDNQNVVEYHKFEPFGQIEESSHTPGTTTKFLYVGKHGVEYHSPHLYYMRARYYNPTNGRFYGEDPVWDINLNPYAGNNPVTNIDPNGEIFETAWDVANLSMGIMSFRANIKNRRYGAAVIDGLGAVADGFATVIPVVPGGFGASIKAVRVAKQVENFSKAPPGGLTKLKGGQGWKDKLGHVWKKDMKHKDHWDVTNPKTGKKIKEIDYNGKQIWPGGSKNKNKL